jgi:hypothetical protein
MYLHRREMTWKTADCWNGQQNSPTWLFDLLTWSGCTLAYTVITFLAHEHDNRTAQAHSESLLTPSAQIRRSYEPIKAELTDKHICAICREEPNIPVRSRLCGHVFCEGCFRVAMAFGDRCPCCTRNLFEAVITGSYGDGLGEQLKGSIGRFRLLSLATFLGASILQWPLTDTFIYRPAVWLSMIRYSFTSTTILAYLCSVAIHMATQPAKPWKWNLTTSLGATKATLLFVVVLEQGISDAENMAMVLQVMLAAVWVPWIVQPYPFDGVQKQIRARVYGLLGRRSSRSLGLPD